MRRERWVWLVGGAIAGLAGVSGAAVFVWAWLFHEDAVIFPIALGLMIVLAQVVRRSRSLAAARLWSATTWLALSGVGFWVFVTYVGDHLPMAPVSYQQAIALDIIWAGFSGMLAVGLFELGRWLAGRIAGDASRQGPQQPPSTG